MCSQISHLDFLHGPQDPSFFRTGGTFALTRISFKLFALRKPIMELYEIPFDALGLVQVTGVEMTWYLLD